MANRSFNPGNLGLSWGFRGFRIGRSQSGTWWVSIGLPFGFRVTQRLGKSRSPGVAEYNVDAITPRDALLPDDSDLVVSRKSENMDIVGRMRKRT
jgi:hypothetical protein